MNDRLTASNIDSKIQDKATAIFLAILWFHIQLLF